MEKRNLTCLTSLAVSGFLAVQALPASAQVQVNTGGATQQVEPVAPPSPEVQVNVPAQRPAPASATVVNNIQTGDSGASGRRMAGKLMAAGGTLFGATYLATVLGAAIASDVCQADSSLGCRQASWPIYVPVVGPFIQMGYINGTGAKVKTASAGVDNGAASASASRHSAQARLTPVSPAAGIIVGLMAGGLFNDLSRLFGG